MTVKVLGTLEPGAQSAPEPRAARAPESGEPVGTVQNPAEHPLVKRAAELFGRNIGDGQR